MGGDFELGGARQDVGPVWKSTSASGARVDGVAGHRARAIHERAVNLISTQVDGHVAPERSAGRLPEPV